MRACQGLSRDSCSGVDLFLYKPRLHSDRPQQQEERSPEAHAHTVNTHNIYLLRCSTSVIAPRGPQLLLPLGRRSLTGTLASASASEHSPLQTPSNRLVTIVPKSSWLGFRLVVQDGARAIVVQDGPAGRFVER